MRISGTRQYEMTEQIQKDLYNQPQALLNKKKRVIVENNYKIWINQYKNALQGLPDKMIATTDRVKLKVPAISFEQFDSPDFDQEYFDLYSCTEDTWSCEMDKPVPSIMETTHYYHNSSAPIPVQDALRDEIIALRMEEYYFEKEKRDLNKYLSDTFGACSTTTKLRRAWPSTLQKYIPPEPPRAARKVKVKPTIDPETLIAPTQAVKERMTENLLQS